MSTMTANVRRTMLFGALGALVLAGTATVVRADVASDKPGAILVFPKVVVDPDGALGPISGVDTELQVVNTSNSVVAAKCFIIDQTSHCQGTTTACTAATAETRCGVGVPCVPPCSQRPVPKIVENDFSITLTKRQPISWKASEGLNPFPCAERPCPGGQSNGTSVIPGVQEVPFIGEVKCVEVDKDTFVPTTGLDPANNFIGDLKGEASIVGGTGSGTDVRKYNGIGLQSTGINNGDETLLVGGPNAEYNGCPKVITLNNTFDDAVVTTHRGVAPVTHSVSTDLTVVPCSEDLFSQNPTNATLQFLVFNEFEQRFSTSTGVNCFAEVNLSNIDRSLDSRSTSIFNFAVEGTLTGQTRIRPVGGTSSDRRVLAVTEEFWTTPETTGAVHSSAANTFFVPSSGANDLGDVIGIPGE